MTPEKRKQRIAQSRLNNEVLAGRIVRPETCERCGITPNGRTLAGLPYIQAHHKDGYDYPYSVEWLCIWCHRRADNNLNVGEMNGRAFLTDEQVREIVLRARQGETRVALAKEFNTTARSVGNFILGLTRKDATQCLDQ